MPHIRTAKLSLADVTIWGAVLSAIGPVALAVTADLTFHFLRRPPPAPLLATASMLQLGCRLAIADCTITACPTGDHNDRPLVHAVGTYALQEARG
jgi:acyl-coenzyme A thioesterase PaaI-like protein